MRYQRLKDLISDHFSTIETLVIEDESRNHAGRDGQESHFKILLVSEEFEGKSRVQRQRVLNALFAQEFSSGLHALTMRLLTPAEYQVQKSNFQSPDCRGSSNTDDAL